MLGTTNNWDAVLFIVLTFLLYTTFLGQITCPRDPRKGKYGTAEVYETIDPADYPERKIMVELDASGNNISLDSNYDEAIVFINGQSTGKTVKDLDSLGPISTDGSVKIYAEITEEGQTLKSDEIPVTKAGQTINLYIDDSPILEAKARN